MFWGNTDNFLPEMDNDNALTHDADEPVVDNEEDWDDETDDDGFNDAADILSFDASQLDELEQFSQEEDDDNDYDDDNDSDDNDNDNDDDNDDDDRLDDGGTVAFLGNEWGWCTRSHCQGNKSGGSCLGCTGRCTGQRSM